MLVRKLREVLAEPGSGQDVGDHRCSTALDEFFSKLSVSYATFPNKFLRAELAEKILIDILTRTSDFRETTVKGGQSDMEWFDGIQWHQVSIKYKGPDKKGDDFMPPPLSRQLSALSWSKNASGAAPTGLTCDMLLIWDAYFDSNYVKPIRGAGAANHKKGIAIITPDEFNPNLEFVESEKQNKTNSAFKISVVNPTLLNPENWVRNLGNKPVIIAPVEGLRIKFSVG